MNYFTGYNTDVLWFPIANNLKEFLTNYINQDGTPLFSDMINYEDMNIGIGSKGTARATYPCLEILFDSEEKGVIHTKIKEGTTNLWLDCYVSDNTTLELTPDINQREMFLFQQNVIRVMKDWQYQLEGALKIKPSVSINGIISDGDTNLPLLMSRIMLEIKWRK